MANFFDQFVTEKEKEKEAPPKNFFDQFVKQAEEPKKEAPKAAAPAPAPAEDKEMVPLLRQTADVPLKVGAGVVTGVRMVADAFGADSGVGQNLRGVEDYIASLYSAQSKKDSKEISRIMKEAEDKGVLDQVVAGAKAFSVAPVDMLANALGTSAPAIAAGMIATMASVPSLAALGISGVVGSLMGAGTVKGAIYEATKQALAENTDMSPKEIEARAVLAQEYGGKNLDQILTGAALGTIGASTGVEPALARQLAKGIATKEATKAAIKQNAAKETALAAERGVVKQGAITGAKELATEFPQGAQEQLAQNIALQREGLDVPTMRGVVGQGTLEGLAGLGMGAVTGGREAAKARRELAEDATRGGNISGQFTTDKEEVQRAGVGFSKESADLLMPASDAAGAPLVGGVTPPEITETTPVVTETKTKKAKTEVIPFDQAAPESIQAANDLIATADSGGKLKNPEIRKIAKAVGLKLPFTYSNAQGVELIRNHLAQQGAPDATGIDTQAGGASAGVAALTDTDQTAAGTAGPQSGGVVSTGTNVGANLAGAKQQPFTLNAGAQSVIISNLDQGATVEQVLSLFPATGELANEVFTFAATYNLASEKLKAGSSPEEVLAVFGDEIATLAAIKKFSPQGTTSGTTTPEAKQTKTQRQEAPTTGTTVKPAGSVSLGDLAPEIQDDIMARREAVYEMVNDGAAANKIAKAYKFLNALEQTHGLDITKPSTLSAKRNKQGLLKTQDIIDEGGQATATEQDKTPAYQGTDLEGALALADKYEKQEEKEKQSAYQESLAGGAGRYDQKNLPPNTEDNYNAVAEEVSAGTDAANATRKGLATKVADLTKQHKEAVAEAERIEDAIEQAERNNDQKKLASLREQENEANRLESDLLGDLIDAQTALQDHGPEQNKLLTWDKLNSADKDIYFSYIRNNTPAEHREAAAALLATKNRAGVKSREGEGKLDAAERRAAQNYEDNRAQMSKIFGLQFPTWDKLSPAAKGVYLRKIVNNAGQQQDVAFAELGVKLTQDNKSLSAKEKQKDIQALQQHQRRVQVLGKRRQRLDQRLRRDYDRRAALGIGQTFYGMLPDNIVKLIKENNLQGVLNYLRNMPEAAGGATSQGRQIAKTVANVIWNMGLTTKIRIVPSLPNEDLAIYDPVADEILVTVEGLNGSTILHEAVHAATVKILSHFVAGRFKMLTASQLAGARQLQAIMDMTKSSLGPTFPSHYKNVLEFVAYALTDSSFQQALNDFSSTLLTGKEKAAYDKLSSVFKGSLFLKGKVQQEQEFKSTLPTVRKAWTDFKLAMAKIFVVGSTVNQKTGVVKNISLKDVLFKKDGELNEAAPKNLIMEISAAFDDILEVPTEPIYMAKLPSSAQGAATPATPAAPAKKEPEFRESGLYEEDKSYNLSERENPTTKRNAFYKMFTTREGWRNITRVVQDKSYASRSLFNKLDRAKKINRDMSGVFNNFEEQGDLSTGEARQFLTDYLQEPLDNVRQSFQEWIKLTDKKTDQALNEFHRIVEMFHEPERRLAKWITSVPLSKTQNLTHNGKPISAAERRIAILGDQRTGTAGLIHKVDLTQQQKQALWQELTSLAENHADPLGDSPRISERMRKRFADPKSTHKGINTNIDAPIYNVLGIEKATVDKRMAEYMQKSPEERAAIEKILAESKVLSDATAKLNQIGNYWSSPVSNLVGMYNYQYYMPFKGLSKHSKSDELIDPESHGKEMQEQEHAADGRFKTSDNPILQLINDAYRSAGRAGRRNYTQSIKNSVEPNKYNPTGTGVIPGKVVDTIKFEERNTTDMSKYKGGANIFHYNADGSIDIIRISDPKILNALRYTFRDASPLLDFSNAVTGFFGAMHTRYNYNFAPLNFVRDTLTNAWTIGASRQMGPIAAAQYLGSVSAQIVKNGLGKAMHVALLEEKGDAASKKMLLDAAQDPFVRDMLEYLRFGGKTTYLQGFSLKSNLEQLSKNTIGRSRIVTNLEDAGRLIDTWNNMFEFTGRTAAYTIYKDRALAKNIKEGMSNAKGPQGQMSPAERAAAVEAAAFVKNLANFEKVGERGRELGAAYMFIRPAATGAVRAIEAVMPAFTREKWEESDIPPQIANDPVAKAEYIKNFKIDRMYAQIMVGALTAGGMGLYFLSMLGAPDDEWGRNNTKTDNMEQWTRFARFHIPNNVSQQLGLGKDLVFQIPWGFGLGAFAATGAQIAGMISGNASIKEGLGNIAGTILLDSFLPLPISKIPVTESSLNWFIDSIAPSVFRPMIEFATNMNGIGQTINSASQRRLGDAFTGSDRIPEIYKDAAKWWFRTTEGEGLLGIPGDISPNTIYFLANSYLDGISKIGEITYNWANLDKGEREFTPKNDIPLFGSFFGAKTNVDSRLYGKVEKKIKEIDKRLYSMKKDDPGQYALYVAKNPLYPSVVDAYQAKQGELNKLRQKATEIRTMRYISPKDRDQIIKTITLEQNMLKHQMVEQFKVLGVEP
jgi:hypothetical protein